MSELMRAAEFAAEMRALYGEGSHEHLTARAIVDGHRKRMIVARVRRSVERGMLES